MTAYESKRGNRGDKDTCLWAEKPYPLEQSMVARTNHVRDSYSYYSPIILIQRCGASGRGRSEKESRSGPTACRDGFGLILIVVYSTVIEALEEGVEVLEALDQTVQEEERKKEVKSKLKLVHGHAEKRERRGEDEARNHQKKREEDCAINRRVSPPGGVLLWRRCRLTY